MIEVSIMATPLMEPSLSKVTELLMKRNMAEKPTVNSPNIRKALTISRPQSNQRLQATTCNRGDTEMYLLSCGDQVVDIG